MSFEFTAGSRDGGSQLVMGNQRFTAPDDVVALSFSDDATMSAPVVFAGYGIVVPESQNFGYDSYATLDVKDKAVVVFRYFPEDADKETKSILARGFPPSAKPFSSIGYAQALRLINGDATHQEAIEETQRQTRNYAKRQWTWFRREQDLVWLDGFGSDTAVKERAADLVGTLLARS